MTELSLDDLMADDDSAQHVVEATVSIVDGWYPQGRVDWEDVWDRLDGSELDDGTRVDVGDDLLAPGLVELKKRVKRVRRA